MFSKSRKLLISLSSLEVWPDKILTGLTVPDGWTDKLVSFMYYILVMNSYLRGIDWSLLEFMNSYQYFWSPSWTNMIKDKFLNPNSPFIVEFSTLNICQKTTQLFFILVGMNLYLWDTNSSKKPYTPLRIYLNVREVLQQCNSPWAPD